MAGCPAGPNVSVGSGIRIQRAPGSGLECAAEPTLAVMVLLHLKRTAAISAVEGHLIERVNGGLGPRAAFNTTPKNQALTVARHRLVTLGSDWLNRGGKGGAAGDCGLHGRYTSVSGNSLVAAMVGAGPARIGFPFNSRRLLYIYGRRELFRHKFFRFCHHRRWLRIR